MTDLRVASDPSSVLIGALELANYFEHLSEIHQVPLNVVRDENLGRCEKGVLLEVEGDKYCISSKKEARELFVERVILKKEAKEYAAKKILPPGEEKITKEVPIVKRFFGKYEDIDGFISLGGYEALKKALKMKPEEIVEEVKRSGLRGRGGAGFPTGLKWEAALKAEGDVKFVVCNADEGEPGTYKDRLIIEKDPHSLIEGMIIAAYAVGANKGYIYIRGEYADVAEKLRMAIEEARDRNFLGENILGADFSFDLTLRFGGGSYIAGEETALLESIEGKAARARFKPPYPTEKGLWGKPTVVNNVETIVKVPWIILNGAEEYRKYGTENSPGTKLFCIGGRACKKELVELPLGVSLREIVYAYAEGVEGDGELWLVQTGGKAGSFVPRDSIDVKMDFSATEKGVVLGSGAIVLIDDSEDFRSLLENVIDFFEHESCGRCVPCREGLFYLKKSIEKGIDFEDLKETVVLMSETALCGLGQTVKNPVLSLILASERGEMS